MRQLLPSVMFLLPATTLCFGGAASAQGAADKPGVSIADLGDRLRIEIGGKLFTEYYYKDAARPYLYPIIGPTGDAMTRNYPMKEVEGEERDHIHHRSLWYAHGDINGHDFWSEAKQFGKTIHQEFIEIKSGADVGVVKSRNKWIANDGAVVCEDTRTLRFYNTPETPTLDFDITFQATNGEIKLGDTKEGSMAIRVASSMRAKGKDAAGHIVNSEGVRDGETWGKRAEWCDYYGPVNGKTVGVAIFDHPQNPKHPTWWHVRDYGLFAANPFGVHDFEKKPAGAGDVFIPAGQSLTFRYRFYFHQGDAKEGQVAEQYKAYAAAKPQD